MYIGIDVGGTSIRVASFNTLNNPKLVRSIYLETLNNYQEDLKNICTAILSLCDSPLGIGMGIPGILDKEHSMILKLPNVRSWDGQATKADLEKKLKTKVFLANDAEAAAMGEARWGYGIDKSFLFIIWGSGVGGTAVDIADKKIVVSPFEPGHFEVRQDGIADGIGVKGSLDALCGGAGIIRSYGKPAATLSESEWLRVEKDFAKGLVTILTIRPSNLIIFGGAITVKQSSRIRVIHKMVKHELRVFAPPEKMLVSKFGEETGLYGALALLKRR